MIEKSQKEFIEIINQKVRQAQSTYKVTKKLRKEYKNLLPDSKTISEKIENFFNKT